MQLYDEKLLKTLHRVIQFNQKAWLKSYIDTNTKLRKEPKNNFQNDFFKLMNAVFEKTMENVRKHRDIKLVIPEKERGRLVLESNYHTTKQFFENLLAIEMKKKTKVKMNKPQYLVLPILEISKTSMYEFWYDYIKPKYHNNAELCYMDTDSFIINIKTEDAYEDIANDVEKIFDTSNFEVNRSDQ